MFDAMVALDSRNSRVDWLTIAEELKSRGRLAAGIGGPTTASARPARPLLVERRRVRDHQGPIDARTAEAGVEIFELASQETGNVLELVDEAGRRIFQIAEKRQQGDLRRIPELMDEALTLLDKMKQNTSGITGTATASSTSTTSSPAITGVSSSCSPPARASARRRWR
jgi:replicative DNA helicase